MARQAAAEMREAVVHFLAKRDGWNCGVCVAIRSPGRMMCPSIWKRGIQRGWKATG